MSDVGTGKPRSDYTLQASVLLAAYKHHPRPVTMVEIEETIAKFTVSDIAHVDRIATRLEAKDV